MNVEYFLLLFFVCSAHCRDTSGRSGRNWDCPLGPRRWGLEGGGLMFPRKLVLQVSSLGPRHQYHLRTQEKCDFSVHNPGQLTQTPCGLGPRISVLRTSSYAHLGACVLSDYIFLWNICPRVGLGSHGSSMFRPLRSLHTVLQRGCTKSYSHQKWRGAP